MTDIQTTAETPEDFGKGDAGLAKRWITAITQAEKHRKQWVKRVEKIIKIYRDDRNELDTAQKFNILWSNVQTLKPALYSRTPKPQVSRRYKDKDPVGRQAAELLERAAEYSLDEYDFDGLLESVVEDHLLGGLGTARVSYEPLYGEEQVTESGEQYQPVVFEKAPCKYVHWRDFLHGPGRTWEEVPWVAFRSFPDRKKLRKRFGDLGNKIPLDYKPEGLEEDANPEEFNKAVVWEVWDKTSKKVYWISLGYAEGPLDQGEPPLSLDGFFPCPKPLLSTTTTDSLTPVPDYIEYQDQAEELNTLTGRIRMLTKALKVSGAYAGDAKAELNQMLEADENKLIPVDSWAAFADRGGIKGLIEWLPVDTIANVLIGLYEARDRVKQDLYEITGMSDIIRGASDSDETATAQRIKGKFASLRLETRQNDVAKFARDLIRLKIEVIAENFSPQTLKLMTGLDVPNEVVELIRNDPIRDFRIGIETDSTIQIDEQAEKEARVEFLTAVSGFLEKSIVAAQQVPEITPLLGEMLLFGVRGFRVGREIEGNIEDALEQMRGAAQQPQAPDPRIQEAAEKSQIEKARLQLEAGDKQASQQFKARELEQRDRELAIKERQVMKDIEFRERDAAKVDAETRSAEVATESHEVLMRAAEQISAATVQNAQAIQSLMEQVDAIGQHLRASDEFRARVIEKVRATGGPRIQGVVDQLTGAE